MPKFEVPDGWTVQAFRFTLDPTEDQAKALARHFGARRKAYNWTVATLKADIQAWHASGTVTAKPSLRVLRKRWNTVKDDVCVNTETGVAWWPECSKEAYADGIAGAVEAYWNWQTSRAGKRAGKRVGFPRFKRKGRDQDRVSFTTGAMRVEPDRRHLTLPVIGTVRTHENTRRIERLIKGRSGASIGDLGAPQRHSSGCQCAGACPASAAAEGGAPRFAGWCRCRGPAPGDGRHR
ncbi:transposase [Mycobacterium tuberculosis]|nr:transposase [Mycobacterium tuberculosis]